MKPFDQFVKELEEKKGPCWTGYKKVPGKKDYEEGSCVKEGDEGFDEYWNSLTEDEQIDYFEVAMEKNGLEIPKGYQVSGELFSKENGYSAMQHILELEEQPTALFWTGHSNWTKQRSIY